jgi:hypothetical protein
LPVGYHPLVPFYMTKTVPHRQVHFSHKTHRVLKANLLKTAAHVVGDAAVFICKIS